MAALALLIAGLFSAGLSHGIVWWLTAFGAIDGPYMAYRHDAIVTALLAVAVVGGVAGLVALACALASGLRGGDAWFAALQRTISGIGPLRAFFAVAGVQFGAIAGLEAIEQVVQFGHTLGLSAALGAPLVVGIPIQALCALLCVVLIFGFARAVVRAESRLRGYLTVYRRRVRQSSGVAASLRPYRISGDIVRLAPLALRFANRPPPSIAA
jgi:hypothetical protein